MGVPGHPQHHGTKKVVLPSGQTIEVVFLDIAGGAGPRAEARGTDAPGTEREMHICPACDSGLVYPVEWAEADHTHWEVELRCPNCEWSAGGVFDQDAVERFDQALDRGTAELVGDLRTLMHANMEEEIESFVRALEADQILPEDF